MKAIKAEDILYQLGAIAMADVTAAEQAAAGNHRHKQMQNAK